MDGRVRIDVSSLPLVGGVSNCCNVCVQYSVSVQCVSTVCQYSVVPRTEVKWMQDRRVRIDVSSSGVRAARRTSFPSGGGTSALLLFCLAKTGPR